MSRPKRYDAIVIGAGSAGLTCAGALAQRGRSVAVVERERVGGECAFWACIPSKTLLRASQLGMTFAEAAAWRTANVDAYDDAEHAQYLSENRVALLRGDARILAPGSIGVDDATYRYGALVLATGSEDVAPPVEGLSDGPYWTSRDATAAGEMPESLVVLGGGAVGVELAQAFARFGSRVTIVEKSPQILADEEPETVAYLADALIATGVAIETGATATSVTWADGGATVSLDDGRKISAARLLAAAGRRARTGGLDLARLGIACDENGAIAIDERCAAAPDVYAAGDVTGIAMFTHTAKYQGRIAAAAICGSPARARYDAVPRCAFTEPEHAAVGLTERQARERGIDCASEVVDLGEASSRAFLFAKDEVRGAVKIVADVRNRTLIGASIVAPMASEMLLASGRAIEASVPIATLLDTIAPYPTFSEIFFTALDRIARRLGQGG